MKIFKTGFCVKSFAFFLPFLFLVFSWILLEMTLETGFAETVTINANADAMVYEDLDTNFGSDTSYMVGRDTDTWNSYIRDYHGNKKTLKFAI
ncbi:MAG: hypothetical protein JRI96_03475 [Deltaproteobacteria bacterium]|nr:hypothetical protein [Deltaproteobacteria bacterium]